MRRKGDVKAVRFLLVEGADVNHANTDDGATALMIASRLQIMPGGQDR